jgi:uncharacterized protein (DUF488 family)
MSPLSFKNVFFVKGKRIYVVSFYTVTMSEKLIYTLGTGLRGEEDFMEILFTYGIEAYIDVRSFPRSKIAVFCKSALSELLRNNGIAYHFLGRELGGLRKGGYAVYTITEEFFKGVAMIEGIAQEKVTVIACSERLPWKCHRKWISRELHKRGWKVEHIIDKGKVWIPK